MVLHTWVLQDPAQTWEQVILVQPWEQVILVQQVVAQALPAEMVEEVVLEVAQQALVLVLEVAQQALVQEAALPLLLPKDKNLCGGIAVKNL